MGALERDPAETAATLTAWLAARGGVPDPRVDGVAIPGSTGWSNETIFFDGHWRDDGEGGGHETHELVARIAPSGYQVFPDETFLRQYAVMHALAERSPVPMPRLLWLEEDPAWFGSPFWIMERISGDIPSDAPPYAGSGWLFDATARQQAQAWWSGIDAMAQIHRLELDALGLPEGILPVAADPLGWQLDHYAEFLAWAEDGTPHTLARHALARLRAERPPDPAAGPSLVWGDARLSNLIYRHFEVVAVLDWEMAGVGDPLADLGWWLFSDAALTSGSGCERLPGFPSRDETASRWQQATGRPTDALDYYERFAGLRFTIIMLRMGKLLEGIGLVPATFAYDNLISTALEELLD